MKQCPLCHIEFPDRLLAPLVLGSADGMTILNCCPICALKEHNKCLGLPQDTQFQKDTKAKQLYSDALLYLKYQNGKSKTS